MKDLTIEDTSEIEVQPKPTDTAAVRVAPVLLQLTGEGAGHRLPLRDGAVIGRGRDVAIRLEASDVSRQHARIIRTTAGELFVEDLTSANGTWINGERVDRHTLEVGDRLQIGSGTLFLVTLTCPLEEQLLQEQRMEATGQLAGGVAHEFNNLMTVMLNDLRFVREHLQQGKGEEHEVIECLDDVERAAQRTTELTRQLLGFARRGRRAKRPVEVGRLIEDAKQLIAASLTPAISLSVEVEPALVVEGDAGQLYQVLVALALNARDAMPEGGALSMRARSTEVSEEQTLQLPSLAVGRHAVISVQDTGQGMEPQIASKVFEPFFTTKGPSKGSGLGLAMAHGIVRSHGGHIRVESRVGWGTTFEVYLPAVPAASREEAARPTSRGAPAIGSMVLVVEDVELERRVVVRLLEQLGYRAIGAADGREAIRVFKEQQAQIKIVVLDLILPGLSGKETFRVLRRIDPKIKVLLVSGYVDESRVADLIKEGAIRFLSKPYDGRVLGEAIAAALGTGALDLT
jgi:two-component system, cell cycle sensor histidine kinase and response regulator CckA